jgi:hypothetical protein
MTSSDRCLASTNYIGALGFKSRGSWSGRSSLRLARENYDPTLPIAANTYVAIYRTNGSLGNVLEFSDYFGKSDVPNAVNIQIHGGNKTQNSAGCIVGTKVAGTPLGNLFAELNSLTLGMPETSANGEAFYRLPIPSEVDVMGAVTQPALHLTSGASGVTVGGSVQLTLTVDNFPRPARPTGTPFIPMA